MSDITITVEAKPIPARGFIPFGDGKTFTFKADRTTSPKDKSYYHNHRFNTNIDIGDRVRINYRGYESRDLAYGLEFIVTDWNASEIHKYNSYSNKRTGIYQQNITLDNGKTIKAINVEKVDGATYGDKPEMLAIGVERPALVQEVLDDDTTAGSPIAFKNEDEAKKYANDQIVTSIREANQYRRFKIYVEKSVAFASEPPVTFK